MFGVAPVTQQEILYLIIVFIGNLCVIFWVIIQKAKDCFDKLLFYAIFHELNIIEEVFKIIVAI